MFYINSILVSETSDCTNQGIACVGCPLSGTCQNYEDHEDYEEYEQ